MKIKVTKQHDHYEIGEHEVDDERGNYLVRVGVAEEKKSRKKDDDDDDDKEKVERSAKKEKVENVKHTPKHEK